MAYYLGNGVPENYKESARWYRKAAEQGHAKAQNSLGFRYAHGRGVPEDYAEAVKWFRKAAEQGDNQAQWSLGVAYQFGEGVIEDKVQAYAWWNICAANGNELGKEWKQKVAEEMTKEQIAKAQDLSREMVKAHP